MPVESVCFSSAVSVKVEGRFARLTHTSEVSVPGGPAAWEGMGWRAGQPAGRWGWRSGSAKASELFPVEPAGTGTDLSWIAGSIGRRRSLPSLNLAAESARSGFSPSTSPVPSRSSGRVFGLLPSLKCRCFPIFCPWLPSLPSSLHPLPRFYPPPCHVRWNRRYTQQYPPSSSLSPAPPWTITPGGPMAASASKGSRTHCLSPSFPCSVTYRHQCHRRSPGPLHCQATHLTVPFSPFPTCLAWIRPPQILS